MLNTTNLFEIELVQHFIDGFGDLLGWYEPPSTVFRVQRDKIPAID